MPRAPLPIGTRGAISTWVARTDDKGIPDEVTVSGWDDPAEAEENGLTTIRHSLHDQGVRCAGLARSGN